MHLHKEYIAVILCVPDYNNVHMIMIDYDATFLTLKLGGLPWGFPNDILHAQDLQGREGWWWLSCSCVNWHSKHASI